MLAGYELINYINTGARRAISKLYRRCGQILKNVLIRIDRFLIRSQWEQVVGWGNTRMPACPMVALVQSKYVRTVHTYTRTLLVLVKYMYVHY